MSGCKPLSRLHNSRLRFIKLDHLFFCQCHKWQRSTHYVLNQSEMLSYCIVNVCSSITAHMNMMILILIQSGLSQWHRVQMENTTSNMTHLIFTKSPDYLSWPWDPSYWISGTSGTESGWVRVSLPCRYHSGQIPQVELYWSSEDVTGIQSCLQFSLWNPVALYLHTGPARWSWDQLEKTYQTHQSLGKLSTDFYFSSDTVYQ